MVNTSNKLNLGYIDFIIHALYYLKYESVFLQAASRTWYEMESNCFLHVLY